MLQNYIIIQAVLMNCYRHIQKRDERIEGSAKVLLYLSTGYSNLQAIHLSQLFFYPFYCA